VGFPAHLLRPKRSGGVSFFAKIADLTGMRKPCGTLKKPEASLLHGVARSRVREHDNSIGETDTASGDPSALASNNWHTAKEGQRGEFAACLPLYKKSGQAGTKEKKTWE
jgi:hypothetical protein